MEAHNLHLAVMQMIEQAHSPSSHASPWIILRLTLLTLASPLGGAIQGGVPELDGGARIEWGVPESKGVPLLELVSQC